MAEQAIKVGTELVYDLIVDVDFTQRPFRCVAESGDEFLAETVVIATGDG
jgi:thioredoxin reductase (NADPH)